jgi:hypothetical protein
MKPRSKHPKPKMAISFLLLAFLHFYLPASLQAQDIPITGEKFIYFPHPPQRSWNTSVGLVATTMPYEVTEELHYRIPAIDVHTIKNIGKGFYADAHLSSQILQNMITVGPRWAAKISDRVSIAVGDDIGYWFASLNREGFKTKASGWQNYPNASIGYRFNKRILLTLKGESIMTLSVNTHAGDIPVTTTYKTFSGSAYSVVLEQPFYGKKSLSLGIRAIYTSFFWQTWTAFTNFDRNFFYPQLIVGLVL